MSIWPFVDYYSYVVEYGLPLSYKKASRIKMKKRNKTKQKVPDVVSSVASQDGGGE